MIKPRIDYSTVQLIASCLFFILISQPSRAQHVSELTIDHLKITTIKSSEGNNHTIQRPLASFEVDGVPFLSDQPSALRISFQQAIVPDQGIKGLLTFENTSHDTVALSNVVPFGTAHHDAYITGLGDHRLSRTHLFLPGRKPVNVIVPDNAWELGYAGLSLSDNQKLFGLVRRDLNSMTKASRKRFETIIAPGGSVSYHFYADYYSGNWQDGLREAFQKRYLYDVNKFDQSLFQRKDLLWINKAYVMHLLMAWDNEFYDSKQSNFKLTDFIHRGKRLFGGDDVVCIWPTWPTLGVDQRNQFDLYRDLPGGLKKIRELADSARAHGSRFFVAYNPWDESTRSEGHLQGLAYLIKETSADGVVLDTKGESSRELQEAADQVKPGVVMYSEGMAVPKDMQGIISGRVHNALYYPPMLNLNKFIRPDFAIFRVAEVFKEPIQREYAVAFFNGYGTEINQFAPGHPDWEEEQYKYLGKTTRILRENTSLFTADYVPLIPTLRDSVWVNQWGDHDKSIYTIFSLKPEGFSGPLFEVRQLASSRWIDLWKHEEVMIKKMGTKSYAMANVDGFDVRDLGTNNEGNVSSIARFSPTLYAQVLGDRLTGKYKSGSTIKIWKGNPSYDKEPLIIHSSGDNQFSLSIARELGRYEGKLVVQALLNSELIDEQILVLKPGTARLVSTVSKTPLPAKLPAQMVMIPAGKLKVTFTQGDEFIPYPKNHLQEEISMPSFAIDRYPVTNVEYQHFLKASGYQPADTTHFLKHWINKKIPRGQENFPVTYVSYEDAQAYATWAGKRLPMELEWQYAAQTPKGNEWPWNQNKPVTRKETWVTETLTVKNIEGIDARHANLGDGNLYPVGKYKKGVNPFGLYDLVGCVWQLTNDVYENGSYRYVMMKGGSYFKPSSSWWYVQGGPRELHYRQFLLRVSPGFERNATVGFRCVADLK
jgi:formylglycine-generating enzyme required for sulfatase activity